MCLDLSGAAHIPVTKLFGRSPAGMNATGESDLKNYYDYVDGLQESKLRPVLERLLPVLLISAWGEVPADVDIQFPPLWTPTAREVADIAKAKTETVINAFQAGLMDRSEAMQELKKLSDETGLFESIAEESIAAAAGQTYQDVTALKDPLAGIVGGEVSDPFDGTATDAAAFDWHGQPRENNGRFTFGKLNSEEYKPFDGYSSSVEEEMPGICYANNVKTTLEKEAIKAYTTNSEDKEINYKVINDYLNGKINPDHEVKAKLYETIHQIDGCIQSETTRNILLYRGQDKPASFFSVGDKIINKGFTSTSISEGVAHEFAFENNGCTIDIKVPKGTKALFIGGGSSFEQDEGEMLFGRNGIITITKVEDGRVEGEFSYGE